MVRFTDSLWNWVIWFYKSQQHPKGFPGGPPPQYWPGLSPLSVRVRMGPGVFDEVWPLAIINRIHSPS